MSRSNRKAVAFGIAGVVALIALPAASALTPAADMPAFVVAGVVVFVLCGARALGLCCADRIVFDDAQRRGRYVPPPHDGKAGGYASVFDFRQRRVISKHP